MSISLEIPIMAGGARGVTGYRFRHPDVRKDLGWGVRSVLRWVLAGGIVLLAGLPARAEVSFSREIAPVLMKRCTGCHGERANAGGWRAHTYRELMKPGASAAKPAVPGNPEGSSLVRLITHRSPDRRMPKGDDPLPAAQVELFRRWIREGAKFDGADPSTPLKSLLGPREHPAAPAVYRTAVPVMAVAFAPGGKELLAGGYHEVTVWDPATGGLLRRLQKLPQRIHALQFSRDGKSLLVGGGTPGEYGEVALVDPATGKRTKVLDTFTDIVLAAAISRDGKLAAAGSADGGVRLYELATGKRLWTSRVHSDWVTGVSFSADGRFVASSGKDMTVKIYETASGALYTTYNGHNRQYGKYKGQSPVYAVQFSPDSALAYSAGGGQWVQIWDPVKAKEEGGDAGDMEERFARPSHAQHLEHGFAQEIFALAVRGGQLFAASGDGVLKQFDLATMKEVRAYRGHTDWIFALDWDPAGGRVATGSYNGEVRVWDPATGKSVTEFKAQPRRDAPARQANRR